MTKLLLSAFSEFPNNNTGGANKVIYQILSGLDYNKYIVDYLSKNLYKEFTGPERLNSKISSSLLYKKKIGKFLFNHSNHYRNFVLGSNYFRNYLKSVDSFYKNFKFQKEYDVVHSHDTRAMYYLGNNPAQKKILTIHSDGSIINTVKNFVGPSEAINSICNDYLIKENESLTIADIITFPSQAAKNLFIEEKFDVDFDRSKIRIVYNGIDTELISNIIPNTEFKLKYEFKNNFDVKILNVADHIENKNIDKVIETIYQLKNNFGIRALLINAGNGPETKDLLNKCKQLNIAEQVIFVGRISITDVVKFLKSTDILISAANRVVFDMIILEALASGTVVIASNNGGNAEAIENGVNGYLVDQISGETFADVIMKIDKSVRNNALSSSKKFDIQNMISEYEKYYT